MAREPITVAIETYDRHAPLLEGVVKSSSVDLQFLQVEQSGTSGRHEEFLQHGRWDAAELSFSSYLVAVDQGLPIHAVPIFPRRLFSQSQLYVNVTAGIDGPADLPGKRVGLSTYQTTLSVLAKGDLAHYYGVSWKEITYVTSRPETVDVPLPPDVKLERADGMQQIEDDLVAGRIHAFFNPRPPRAFIDGHPNVKRLFEDPRAEEQRHIREPGYFPIMHVAAYRQSAAERHPKLPRALFDAFEEARRLARERWNDPNWSLLLWGKQELERESQLQSRDPWQNGLAANRRNIEDFVTYSHEQGLIRRLLEPEELFAQLD
jgi:4,5-dihydroxyphthalate decarboxylase